MARSIETPLQGLLRWEASGFAGPARRIRWVLFSSMSLSSAAFIGIAAINPIQAAQLGGSAAWAGVPSAMILTGSALASPAWGYFSERRGRRAGLTAGLVIGVIGAALAGLAFLALSLPGFLAGLALVGAGSAAVSLSRFAAAG